LTAAQLEVADLRPPVSEADDVVVRWKDLLQWRDEAKAEIGVETLAAVDSVSVAVDAAKQARAELTASLRKLAVPEFEPYSAQVASELEKARRKVGDNEKTLSTVKKIEVEIEESSSEAAVAEVLSGHLRANGFEQWLMAGALSDLVDGANGLLGELSSGGYSLHSDDVGTFSIVDHRNADEMRSVSTLSGGETFLVSLALALSLAETLAAAGGARLDAIILDEGFGTLDTESLDTVASVLEGLAGEGLMVGVITHVKELAARAPTRFEVTREPTGSKVVLVS
jgi:exonuclease SbcC